MKFIVVDDNKTFRESIVYLLENIYDHQVIGTASNGAEFLELDTIHKADIILMDIEMPEMNGIEAVKQANWKFRQNRYIAVTSYTDIAYLTELVSAGFKACIFKDNFYMEFEETVNRVMNNEFRFPGDLKIGDT